MYRAHLSQCRRRKPFRENSHMTCRDRFTPGLTHVSRELLRQSESPPQQLTPFSRKLIRTRMIMTGAAGIPVLCRQELSKGSRTYEYRKSGSGLSPGRRPLRCFYSPSALVGRAFYPANVPESLSGISSDAAEGPARGRLSPAAPDRTGMR